MKRISITAKGTSEGARKGKITKERRKAIKEKRADRYISRKGQNYHKEQLHELHVAHKLEGKAPNRHLALLKAWETRFDIYGPHGCRQGRNGRADGQFSKKYRSTKKRTKTLLKSTRKDRRKIRGGKLSDRYL